jgi:hypothetical protein
MKVVILEGAMMPSNRSSKFGIEFETKEERVKANDFAEAALGKRVRVTMEIIDSLTCFMRCTGCGHGQKVARQMR